jgi:hypothetical protein
MNQNHFARYCMVGSLDSNSHNKYFSYKNQNIFQKNENFLWVKNNLNTI